jgi:hypothetical protein
MREYLSGSKFDTYMLTITIAFSWFKTFHWVRKDLPLRAAFEAYAKEGIVRNCS